jgi:hypothetical protein
MYNHAWYGGIMTQTITVNRRDGWNVWLKFGNNGYTYPNAGGNDGYWHASANAGRSWVTGGIALFSSVTADSVKFNLRWPNGVEGAYTGAIRSDGYVSGVMVERTEFGTIYRTYWSMSGRAVCSR